MQNIGLMMTYNEEDIIEETLTNLNQFFDKILVIDGSTDKTPEILQSFDNVVYYLRDDDLCPKRKITDGVRQFLLEEAQKRYGYDGWFTLLHGDEMFVDNPNIIAEQAEKKGAEMVNWHMLQFFLHTSDFENYDDLMPIEKRLTHYHPGGLEIRQFKNKKGVFFKLDQMKVLPYGLKNKPFLDYPIMRHYPNRSIRQLQKRPSTGFLRNDDFKPSKSDLEEIKKKLFVEKLNPKYKQTRIYDGSYHELEAENRPSFFQQWLAWRKYKEIDWGIAGLLIPSKHKEYKRKIFK